MLKNIIFAGVLVGGENKFDPAILDVRFNASRVVITKICSISNLQLDPGSDADVLAIFSLYMSNSVDSIAEVVVDGTARSDFCHEVVWMPNMISGGITFKLRGISFDTTVVPPQPPDVPQLIGVLGPNTILTLTVHMWFEE
jgi:hypothetical protein